jgi:hypothetical protein
MWQSFILVAKKPSKTIQKNQAISEIVSSTYKPLDAGNLAKRTLLPYQRKCEKALLAWAILCISSLLRMQLP